ncbi:hypothetical protein WMW72_13780 [Paenibacillus filicis]|uniref:Uncharacterized protein n=1 Tax=Paenibacillus filicis TaxID=669464 RepID=A0ABU9DJM0_9BACL
MESLTVYFDNQRDLEHAAQALREQGAVNVKGDAAEVTGDSDADMTAALQASAAGTAPEVHMLQIVVESSRLRQAEDTISRYGGWL